MSVLYKLFMGIAGSLCSLIMLVLLDVPERIGRLVDRGDCRG